MPVWLLIIADRYGPAERRSVPVTAPTWFFDGQLYLAAVLQIINIILIGVMVSQLRWDSVAIIAPSFTDLLILRILGGTNACCSVIAPAHELIHRRSRWQRSLGRLMLISVFYDHFFISHKLGHHARLGYAEDPSTAYLHEDYDSYLKRSISRQWQLAWQNRPRAVVKGIAVEVLLMVLYGLFFGPLALFVWMYLSWVAIRLLEAVNYFQHFGMTVQSGHSGYTAWRCDSAVSLFMFFSLTRHADHHRRPAKPYQELQSSEKGPLLPYGYLGMALWVKNASRSFRDWAGNEMLSRKPVARPCATDVEPAPSTRSG